MSPALPSVSTTRAVGVALALALGLSGCGAGLRAQTYQERATSDSTNEAIGAIAVRNIRVLPPTRGDSYPVGSDARVAFTLVNEGAEGDRLTSVTTDSAATVAVVGADGRPATLDVPAQSGAVASYAFVLRGLTRELRPGQYVQMELTFATNGAEAMLVPVEVTGIPGPRRTGYRVPETDSVGNPVLEGEEEPASGAEGAGSDAEGTGASEGSNGSEGTGGSEAVVGSN